MIKELSVLIPVYNNSCVQLVRALHQQLSLTDISFEIIIADDGSTDRSFIEENKSLSLLTHVQYLIRKKNIGRAAIRNVLVQQANYSWLLFIDGDLFIKNDSYIHRYLSFDENNTVVYGGYTISGNYPDNLRWRIEKKHEEKSSADKRQQHPYHDFHTCNFLVKKDIMKRIPFNEKIREYGYEDVLWGKQLKEHHITLTHIDNPVSFERFEDNQTFIHKTEEALHTLYTLSASLKGYSSVLNYSSLHPLLKFLYGRIGKYLRKQLIDNNPPLFLFYIYKLLYYHNIEQ